MQYIKRRMSIALCMNIANGKNAGGNNDNTNNSVVEIVSFFHFRSVSVHYRRSKSLRFSLKKRVPVLTIKSLFLFSNRVSNNAVLLFIVIPDFFGGGPL